jgi:hypothetical protein
MITGYNTDIRHSETVVHVQTEDKGRDNPFIESVIYIGGRVVTTKRSSYSRLLEEGKGDPEIAALMDHQHRTILAAIRAGRFDTKLQEVLGRTPPSIPPAEILSATRAHLTDEVPLADAKPAGNGAAAARAAAESAVRTDAAAAEPVLDDDGPTLDQVILDYLSTEAEHEQLILVVDGQEEIQPGQRNLLTLRAYSSKSGLPLAGVHVAVKMLSTIADPRTLLIAETDDVGALEMHLELPNFSRGSAALIISGSSDLGRAEIKQLL